MFKKIKKFFSRGNKIGSVGSGSTVNLKNIVNEPLSKDSGFFYKDGKGDLEKLETVLRNDPKGDSEINERIINLAKSNNISFVYENDILPFAKRQVNLTFITGDECTSCCAKNYLSIKGLEELLEDGKCVVCSKETKVFNSFIARQVIQKYGFGINDYFDVKQKFINDMK